MEEQQEFLDVYREHMEMIAKGMENLSARLNNVEKALGRMPTPGADMIKYKPDGYEDYLNMRELFDDMYMRLNMMEDRIDQS
jgi:hypothetical protein